MQIIPSEKELLNLETYSDIKKRLQYQKLLRTKFLNKNNFDKKILIFLKLNYKKKEEEIIEDKINREKNILIRVENQKEKEIKKKNKQKIILNYKNKNILIKKIQLKSNYSLIELRNQMNLYHILIKQMNITINTNNTSSIHKQKTLKKKKEYEIKLKKIKKELKDILELNRNKIKNINIVNIKKPKIPNKITVYNDFIYTVFVIIKTFNIPFSNKISLRKSSVKKIKLNNNNYSFLNKEMGIGISIMERKIISYEYNKIISAIKECSINPDFIEYKSRPYNNGTKQIIIRQKKN